ncbi:MAG: PAS domain S-box protein [Candidatus Auribacterota bacterium]|nr:PAS domain S-box protein [Candidatus Auribacterota bacterium]
MKAHRATEQSGKGEFETLIENSLDVIMRFDRDLRHLYVNSLVQEQTGIPPEKFIGKTHAELGFPSELIYLWEEALKKVFRTGESNRVEFQLPEGIWIDWLLVPEYSADGRVETVITTARDITDRKKAEESLARAHRELESRVEERTAELAREITERKQAEETLRLIVEGSPGFFFYVHDPAGNFLYISPSVLEITGRDPENWMKHYTTYLTDNLINRKVIEYTEKTLRGEESQSSYPVEIEHADEKRIFLQVYERPIIKDGEVVGIQGVAHDVSEKLDREAELVRLSSALASLSEMVIITDLEHRIIYANQATEELLGYCPEELIGRDSRELFDNVPGNPTRLSDVITREAVNDFWRGDIFDRTKDGSIICVNLTMTALKGEEDKAIGWVGISTDVTEWKRAEKELKFLSSITRQVTDAIVVTNKEFKINYLNLAAEKMYGYPREELLGKSPEIFNVSIASKDIQKNIYQTISSSRTWQGTNLNQRKDGSTFSCECKISPLLDSRGEITSYIGILRDVTVRRKLEERLRHAQKMEAIGTLAGGIAHDFNNILAGISGYAFLAKQRLGRDSTPYKNLTAIEKLSHRGSELTNSLLTFSRRSEFNPIPVNINRIAEEVMEIIKETTGGKFDIQLKLEDKLPNIVGDEGMVHQVLMNLSINACDAMAKGGILTIETDFVLPPDYVEEKAVMLKISDTGIGMDDKTKERIFEPFFTTKGKQTGTGLGLSIVKGIVDKHKGMIEVDSAPGEGSIFTIYCPATDLIERTPDSTPVGERGRETILIVDDDIDFRLVTRKALEQFGYSILEASSGESALRKYDTGLIRIDLVLLDIRMKGMGGAEALRKFKEKTPDLPIIVCSGYTDDITVNRLRRMGAGAYLPKPFEYKVLAATIRELLDD